MERKRCKSGKHHKTSTIDELVWNSFIAVVKNSERLKTLFAEGESSESRDRRKAKLEKIIITNDAEITIVLEGGIEWTV